MITEPEVPADDATDPLDPPTAPQRILADRTPLTCPVCGTPTVPRARYCFNCGVPLETATAAPDEAAERRVVTVLFGDLSDFTAWAEDLDPERVSEVTDRVLAALARTVADVGGRVDKLTGDGIMAVFGAPTAHEDDAERAVRAAATMQETVRRLVADEAGGGRRLGLRVGLNTGEVLAGVQAALSYTVIGDTVNTAARLSDVAGVGTVYAGRLTAAATMSAASWRTLAPLRLKGKREPVPAYELMGLRPSHAERFGLGDEAPFVGRDAELGALTGRFLDTMFRGTPRTVAVVGEAGVGKTRAVQELDRFVGEVPGARTLWGRAVPYGEGRDLLPIAQVVRTACGIEDGDDVEAAVERVRRTLARLDRAGSPTGLPALVGERLLTLLGLPTDAPARRDGTTAETQGPDTLLDAVAALLRALAAEEPLLLCMDDLQWATDELWRSVRRVAGRLTGAVTLVLIGREAPELDGLPDPEILAVGPLEDAAAERLLRAYLGGADLDQGARAALLGRARGNPFFLAELLHLLVDRGVLRPGRKEEDGGEPAWTLDGELPADALPAGVQAVLAARIDGLEPVAKAVLRSAAVLGNRFPAEALARVEGRRAETVREALGELSARQLVRGPEHGEALWSFTHPMARDVAYAGLPKAERARRHARAARWAARAMTGTPSEVDSFVAGHAEAATRLAESMALPAGDSAWAARSAGTAALVRLGRSAISRDDHRTAADRLERARRLGRDAVPTERLLAARVLHAEALASLRRTDEAEDALRPALTADNAALRAHAYEILGDIRLKQGRDTAAATALVTALAQAADAGDDRVSGAALRQLGQIDYAAGRLRAAEVRYRDALRLARQVGDPRGAGWALQRLAWSAMTRGDYPTAGDALRDAKEVFVALEDIDGTAWCRGTEALVRVLSGRLAEARELVKELIPLAEGLGDRWGLGACLTIDALAAAEMGDVHIAEEEATLAYAAFETTNDTWGRALALVARGMAARGAGEPARAMEYLRDAASAAGRGRHAVIAAFADIILGFTALDCRLPEVAQAAAESAQAAFEVLELQPHAGLGARVLSAQVLRARGCLDEAIEMLQEALAAGEPETLLFPRRQAYSHLAGTLLDAGRVQEALRTAQRAVEIESEDVRARVLALRALGNALAAAGDVEGARTAYGRALASATATDASSEVTHTRRLLASLPG